MPKVFLLEDLFFSKNDILIPKNDEPAIKPLQGYRVNKFGNYIQSAGVFYLLWFT